MIQFLPIDLLWMIIKLVKKRHPLILVNKEISLIVDHCLPPKNPKSLIQCIERKLPEQVFIDLLNDPRTDPSVSNDAALVWALRSNRDDVVRLILKDSRVNPNQPPGYKLALGLISNEMLCAIAECERFDVFGQNNTALVHAARRNWPEAVSTLLKRSDSDPNRYSPLSAALCAARNPNGYQKFQNTIHIFLSDPRLVLSMSHLRIASALDDSLFHMILTDERFVPPHETDRFLGELHRIASSSRWTIPKVRKFLILHGTIQPSFEIFQNTLTDISLTQEILAYGKWESKSAALNILLRECIVTERYHLVAIYTSWAIKWGICLVNEIRDEAFLQPCLEFLRCIMNDPVSERVIDDRMIQAIESQESFFVNHCLTLSDWRCYTEYTAQRLFDLLFHGPDSVSEEAFVDFEPDQWGSYSFASLLFRCFVMNCGTRKNVDHRKIIDIMIASANKNGEISWDPNGNAICYLLSQAQSNPNIPIQQLDLLEYMIEHPILGIESCPYRCLRVIEYMDQDRAQKLACKSLIEATKNGDFQVIGQLLGDRTLFWYSQTIKECFEMSALKGNLKVCVEILMKCTLFKDNGGIFDPDFLYDLIDRVRNLGHTKTANTIERFALYDQRIFYFTAN